LAETLGGRVKIHKQKRFGDILEIRFGGARSPQDSDKPIMLLGHLDTVWPLGTLRTMPWRERDGRIFGPGVLDMKAGVTMALAAVRALESIGLRSRPVTLLLNSDEEVGSPVSRLITERLALASSAVLVLEPAQGLACKTARKGVAGWRSRALPRTVGLTSTAATRRSSNSRACCRRLRGSASRASTARSTRA
jgi:glutamate carboxypeptidase